MTYYIYHIPGKKIGVTRDLNKRVTEQQGYEPHEYEVLHTYNEDEIEEVSLHEAYLQKKYGYPVDIVPYDKLNCNKNKLNMNINITEQTTTFPCPANKLKGQLMDNIGMTWGTDHGEFIITPITIKWIMKNIKTSMFNDQRSYVYNKAFARFYDNNDVYARDKVETSADKFEETRNTVQAFIKAKHKKEYQTHDYPSNGRTTLTGGLAPTGMKERSYECCDENNPCVCEPNHRFELIREWADERGLYDKGDVKTQTLKLMEEAGEICKATLKEDRAEIIDGIGDCVVVLTNLAELHGVTIENCIDTAYKVIKNRTGKMVNGTYKKD